MPETEIEVRVVTATAEWRRYNYVWDFLGDIGALGHEAVGHLLVTRDPLENDGLLFVLPAQARPGVDPGTLMQDMADGGEDADSGAEPDNEPAIAYLAVYTGKLILALPYVALAIQGKGDMEEHAIVWLRSLFQKTTTQGDKGGRFLAALRKMTDPDLDQDIIDMRGHLAEQMGSHQMKTSADTEQVLQFQKMLEAAELCQRFRPLLEIRRA